MRGFRKIFVYFPKDDSDIFPAFALYIRKNNFYLKEMGRKMRKITVEQAIDILYDFSD